MHHHHPFEGGADGLVIPLPDVAPQLNDPLHALHRRLDVGVAFMGRYRRGDGGKVHRGRGGRVDAAQVLIHRLGEKGCKRCHYLCGWVFFFFFWAVCCVGTCCVLCGSMRWTLLQSHQQSDPYSISGPLKCRQQLLSLFNVHSTTDLAQHHQCVVEHSQCRLTIAIFLPWMPL